MEGSGTLGKEPVGFDVDLDDARFPDQPFQSLHFSFPLSNGRIIACPLPNHCSRRTTVIQKTDNVIEAASMKRGLVLFRWSCRSL